MSSSTQFFFEGATVSYPPVKPPWLRPGATAVVIAVHAFVAWLTLVTSAPLYHQIDVTLVPSGSPLGLEEQEADNQPPEEVEQPALAMPAPMIMSPDAPVKEEIVKPKKHVVPKGMLSKCAKRMSPKSPKRMRSKRERPRRGRIRSSARRGAERLACPRDERRRAAAWTTPRCWPSRSGGTRRARRPSAPARRASNFMSTPTEALSESPPRDPIPRSRRWRVASSPPFTRRRRREVRSTAFKILSSTDRTGRAAAADARLKSRLSTLIVRLNAGAPACVAFLSSQRVFDRLESPRRDHAPGGAESCVISSSKCAPTWSSPRSPG